MEGDLNEIEKEIEQGPGAQVPKSFKNAGGAYKMQKEE